MTKVEQTFDVIHGTQKIFRKLLDCMSRPGKIETIQETIVNLNPEQGISQGLLGIAFTLVDREASYHIISSDSEKASQYVKWATFSHEATLENADYIFIGKSLGEQEIIEVMRQVKTGTLTDPHQSATLIIHVDQLLPHTGSGLSLQLRGPGIKDQQSVSIKGLSPLWFDERQLTNKEYPIGVDFIFVSSLEEIMAIPRTTKVEWEDLKWDM